MSFRPSPSSRARLHALRPGQHLCLFYDRPDEQIGISLEYIRGGLHRNERCLYCADRDTLETFRLALRDAAIDVDAEIARGALLMLTKEQGHLAGGRFDMQTMIAMLGTAVQSALDDGFTALRAAGDMTWILDNAPGSEDVVEYEAMMNEFYAGARALGLCLYDRQRHHPVALEAALRTHPAVLIGDRCCGENPFYENPDEFFQRIDARDRFNLRLNRVRSLATVPEAAAS